MFKGTTILTVRVGNSIAMAGDGQVSLDYTIVKHGAKKVRTLYNGKVLAGFAGSTADALTLFEKFEINLEQNGGRLAKAAVELGKEWRTDKVLRRLEALLIVADKENMLLISGSGDVIEPDDNIIAVGSGGCYALAAARAMVKHSNLSAKEVAQESLKIASTICIYTNDHIMVESL